MPEPGIGDALELRVEKAVHGGLGLARLAGQAVLLPRALPGERVRAELTQRARGYLRAEVLEVIEASPERRSAPCPHFAECGGCAWQALGYPAQLALKRDVLRESLARAGAPWPGPLEVIGSPETAWRTRAVLHAARHAGRLRLGLHRRATHEVVEVGSCGQLSDPMRAVVAELGSALEAERLGDSLVQLRLAESGDGARRVGCVVLSSAPTAAAAASLRRVAAATPALSGLVATGNAGGLESVSGDPRVEARVHGVRFGAHVASFFQANRFLLEPLVDAVLEQVPAAAQLADLYAGVGLFAIAAAARLEATGWAVELSPWAVRDARANAEAQPRVRVERADARVGLGRWRPGPGPRVIVVDPPRSGLPRALVEDLAEQRAARLVYVSCDPPSLGRDLARFARLGWSLRALRAFDMFPDTFHLESVATLEATASRV